MVGTSRFRIDLKLDLIFPLNEVPHANIPTRVGQDVFILGYPMGIDSSGLPIWKRGSIATEPHVDVDKLPMIYVDSAASRGMSGSPVIIKTSSYQDAKGNTHIFTGEATAFVGIYSGRIAPNDQGEAHLGIVWKAKVIDEIITGIPDYSIGMSPIP